MIIGPVLRVDLGDAVEVVVDHRPADRLGAERPLGGIPQVLNLDRVVDPVVREARCSPA